MPSTGLDRDNESYSIRISKEWRDYWFSQSIGKPWCSFLILFYQFKKENVSKKKIHASVTVPASGCWYRGWGPTCNRHHSEQQRWLEKFSHDYAMATNFVADVVWSVSVLSVNVNSWQHSITKSWLRQSLYVYIFHSILSVSLLTLVGGAAAGIVAFFTIFLWQISSWFWDTPLTNKTQLYIYIPPLFMLHDLPTLKHHQNNSNCYQRKCFPSSPFHFVSSVLWPF